MVKEDQIQAEAEVDSDGETYIGDSSTKTEGVGVEHNESRQNQTNPDIRVLENEDTAVQSTYEPSDSQVKYHEEEADTQLQPTHIESDRAYASSFVEKGNADVAVNESIIAKHQDKQQSLDSEEAENDGKSETAYEVPLQSPDPMSSDNEVGPSFTDDPLHGRTISNDVPAVSAAENKAAEVEPLDRSPSEKAARQSDRQVTSVTTVEDSLIEMLSNQETGQPISVVSSPENDLERDVEIQVAAGEGGETQAEGQITDATSGIDDWIAMVNVTGVETTSSEDIAADDIVEDVEIKRALVEPDREYTESPRQMALTSEEELRLQDIEQAMRTNAYNQSQMAEFSREFDDLAERARLVSRTYERGHKIPTKWELEECQELMHVMGVPVVLAHPPFEAEGLASAMTLAGIADFVGTEDSDVLGYEAPLLRNVATTSKPMEIVEGNCLRSAFSLSPVQFIDFLVLLGTDASSRIPGVGPVKAMKLIQKHDTIEGILDANEKLRELAGPDYLQEVDAAREVFAVLPPLPRREDLETPQTDENAVLDYLRQKHGIDSSTDLGILYETEGDIKVAFEAFQKQSSVFLE